MLYRSIVNLSYELEKLGAHLIELVSPLTGLFSQKSSDSKSKRRSSVQINYPRFRLATLKRPLNPVKKMLHDIQKTFRPYKDLDHDLKKDLKMPLYGLQNIVDAALALLLMGVRILLFVPNQLYAICKTVLSTLYQFGWESFNMTELFRGIFLKAILVETLLEPLWQVYLTLAIMAEAVLQTLRGASQILIGTPALLLRVPLRVFLNYLQDPKVEDNLTIQATIDKCVSELGTSDRPQQALLYDSPARIHRIYVKNVRNHHRPTEINPHLEEWAYSGSSSNAAASLAYFGLFKEIKLPNGDTYNKEQTAKAWEDEGSREYHHVKHW